MNPNQPIPLIATEEANQSSLLAVSTCFLLALLPHFVHLPLWVTGMVLFALIWRGLQTNQWMPAFPKWILIPMVVAGGIGVFAQYWTIAGRDAGLALLTVMTSFKFLEAKTHRDILILIFLSYFILATHFLFGQSIGIALYMLANLVVITATLITINQRDEDTRLTIPFKKSAQLLLYSLPIMVVLFILVPRIPGPLWGLTTEQRAGITGLSDSMTPGSISDLITSNDVAFRVNFNDDIPAQQQLYWRGPVMSEFNGRSWSRSKAGILRTSDLSPSASSTQYTVTLEAHGKHWMLALDIPDQIPDQGILTSEFQLLSKKPINDLIRYDMSSQLNYQLARNESFDYLAENLEFPQDSNPRTLAMGQQWAREIDRPIDIITRALTMFRNQEYIYTLTPPLLGRDSSDEFLFQTRRGFCEHYASSFTLLMRAAGLPARVVTGYQGGEINEVGDYLIVRQSDAHAWSEVWLEDRGWIRIDPTAAVSPDRIEQGIDQALPNEVSSFRFSRRTPLISQFLYNWDSIKHRWNDMVLNYDHRKQSRFLNNLGVGIRSWGDMVIALVITIASITAIYWLVGWYREKPAPLPSHEKALKRLLGKLRKMGLERLPSEPLLQFLKRINTSEKYFDPKLRKIFDAYNRIKYARGYQNTAVINRFHKMVDEWKPNSKSPRK